MFQLFGTWFLSRWYLPQEKNVTDEKYDQQLYGYQKSGLPNTAFCDHFSRYLPNNLVIAWSDD